MYSPCSPCRLHTERIQTRYRPMCDNVPNETFHPFRNVSSFQKPFRLFPVLSGTDTVLIREPSRDTGEQLTDAGQKPSGNPAETQTEPSNIPVGFLSRIVTPCHAVSRVVTKRDAIRMLAPC